MNAYKSFNELIDEASQNGVASFVWFGQEFELAYSSNFHYIRYKTPNVRYVASVGKWTDDWMEVYASFFSDVVRATIRIEDVFRP
jgi:hypothetical protein